MTRHLLSMALLLMSASVVAQTVTGRVAAGADGSALPGVSILVKGTSNGTSTDADGRYSINVPDANTSVLVISFIGFNTQEVAVGNRTVIDVTLVEDIVQLGEVVVTALGLERSKTGLTYTVQDVKTEELAEARELNVINSLSGKIAGMSINRAGTGVGSGTRVILRGNRSISGDSQPLYILDGVPLNGDMSDINPDDIESITVLKGPNAAAIYGGRGNNGAIVINTKKGRNVGKGFTVDLNTTYMLDAPILLTNYQNLYGQGNSLTYSPNSENSWGPRMDGQTVAHWSPDPNRPANDYPFSPQPDNVKDFFQTGRNFATSLAINSGTEKNQTYFSYTYTDAAGVVPTNELTRHNFNLRLTNKLTDRLALDAKINYIREDIHNQLSQGESFDNPIRHAYRLPRNIRTSDIERFEYVTPDGVTRQNYWNPGSNGGANPYWTINRNLKKNITDRVIALASLKYNLTPELSVMVRSAIDRSFGMSDTRFHNDSYIFAQNGRFFQGRSDGMEWNSDFLITYQKNINEDWFFSVNAGGNNRKNRNSALDANTGPSLTVPNFFALGNTQQVLATHNVGGPKDVNSLYAFGQLTFRNAVFLDLSARNDWSSALPKDNWSFFYPSVGLNVVLSDLIDFPAFFSFAKLRTSYAGVGNDTSPYQLQRTAALSAGGKGGFLTLSSTLPNENLLPEDTKSIEVGGDFRFLTNRAGLDITYYKTNSTNQLFTVALPVGSGASSFFTNGGDVQNQGVEMIISGSPMMKGDFRWDVTFNFARNISLVKKINDERPSVEVGADFLRRFRIEEGRPFGEVYSRGFQRDAQGRVLVEPNGLPMVTAGFTVRVANYNPDWLGGIQNSFSYKNFRVNFVIDMRQGGSISSLGNAIIYADGLTEETLQGREGGLIFGQNFFSDETAVNASGAENTVPITAEQFWLKVGGRNAPAGEVFTVDASNIRFREAVIGYSLPASMLTNGPFRKISLSFVGRNLFFLSNKANNLDPDVTVGTGKESAGYDSFGPPTARSYGFNLNLGF